MLRHIQRLEVLGFAGCWGHGGLLGSKEGVDCGGLAHIGVASQANHEALSLTVHDLQVPVPVCTGAVCM